MVPANDFPEYSSIFFTPDSCNLVCSGACLNFTLGRILCIHVQHGEKIMKLGTLDLSIPMHHPVAAALLPCTSTQLTLMCEVPAVIIGTATMHVYVKYWMLALGTDDGY